jgi:hypothetical protein
LRVTAHQAAGLPVGSVHWNSAAKPSGSGRPSDVSTLAHVQPVGVLERRGHSELGDELGQHSNRQDLAVGNDAVEIVNDQPCHGIVALVGATTAEHAAPRTGPQGQASAPAILERTRGERYISRMVTEFPFRWRSHKDSRRRWRSTPPVKHLSASTVAFGVLQPCAVGATTRLTPGAAEVANRHLPCPTRISSV